MASIRYPQDLVTIHGQITIHVTFIVLCCIVLALAIHSAYFIKRFSLLTAMMSNKLLGLLGLV